MKYIFDGFIKPDFTGKHGKVTINNSKYINHYSKRNVKILKFIKFIQSSLYKMGIAVHDPIFGECTPDFNCCVPSIGRKSFININENKIQKLLTLFKM